MNTKPTRWAIIEGAGMEYGDRVVHECEHWQAALRWRDAHYDRDEVESLHVDLARWDAEQECWTYDH